MGGVGIWKRVSESWNKEEVAHANTMDRLEVPKR